MRDAIAAAAMDTRGRSDFGAAFRSKAVTDTIDEALKKSGDVAFKDRFREGVLNATKSGEFDRLSAAEKALLEKLTQKASWGNLVSDIGKQAGKAGVYGAGAAGLAYGTGQADPTTAALAAGGSLAGGRILRGIGERYATSKAEKFAEQLRQRSQLYQDRVAISPTQAGPGLSSPLSGLRQALTIGDQGEIRDALARIMLKHTTGDQNAP
jgi:hypothetical protein